MPDFPAARIPAAAFNSSVHAAMTDLVQRRDRCDHDLHLMVHDEAADGTPLDPQRNYEPEYEMASERLNGCNRQLYTIYARYLDRPSRPLLLQPEASVQQPADSANMAEMLPSTPDIPPCPYQHAADMPTPGPTTPTKWLSLPLVKPPNKPSLPGSTRPPWKSRP